MLVISRYVDETIVIGEGEDQIVIRVNKVRGANVSIGIDAPRHIPILRGELLDGSREKDRHK